MTICLNMIVRDEAHLIKDTLYNICSCFPIDYWVISDTGSTDDTKEIIRQVFQELDIPGELAEDEWVDFSHNRNLALRRCHGKSDYVLFFDADDKVTGKPQLPDMTADAYHVVMESYDRSHKYFRKLIVKNTPEVHWKGVVHEFIVVTGKDIGTVGGEYSVISGRTGARSRDPEKYRKDALLLENAITSGQDRELHVRYVFYCANSWRDYGDRDQALKWYVTRTKLKGWIEETYMAFLGAGLQLEHKKRPDLALDFFLQGHNLVPERAEGLYHAARSLRHRGAFHSALIFAKQALDIPMPVGNRLFLDKSIYEYWAAYEFLFLTARIGGNPELSPHYDRFMASRAPQSSKDSIKSLL
ncbi:glycosyl transferase family 2 [Pseudosulfitobacter pseudonitzschiae]|uniref:Glycosyl transferase family 2 n=2 Tax=Rhodobacterales TaxID=204455 RepID=A0A221JX35_9RHOB|nr:glycosyl transferase family 2 [Pseudosulfitobacter pseudonitzschiae]